MAKKHPNGNNYQKKIFTILQENRLSFLIGLTLFILTLLFMLFSFKNRLKIEVKENVSPTKEEQEKKEKTYQVKEGDHLWKIAEEVYGSGYNAYDIALANNIGNPSVIYKDLILVLPDVSPKLATIGETLQTATTEVASPEAIYTIQPGDSLWSIAVEFYGDGYAWVTIAKENNLANPNLIHGGNVLKIPKN